MPTIRLLESHLVRLLKLIFSHGPVSRSLLAQQTGYSTFLLSKLSEKLLLSGYVTENGSGNSTGGRRPKLLSITPGLGRLVGVDFGTVNLRIAVTDVAGNVLGHEKHPSPASEGAEAGLPRVIDLIEGALRRAKVKRDQLWGLGMGISVVLDRTTGTAMFWPKVPEWVNVPLRKMLADHFHTATEVDDSVRMMALAERRFGAAAEARQFVYVMLGAGIGSALFLNGCLHTGTGGFAGEFGHIQVQEDGPLCSCGNKGCVEVLASASALICKAKEAMASGLSSGLWEGCQGRPEGISVELIVQAAREGDRFCLGLLNEAGKHIGTGIVGLVNLLNPELIVLGGRLASAAAEFILLPIRRSVCERALERAAGNVRIELSTLDEMAWATGAALSLAEKVLESRFLETVHSHKLASVHAVENQSGGGSVGRNWFQGGAR